MKKSLSQDKRSRLKISELSVRKTAQIEGVSPSTVQKWQKRTGVEDKQRKKLLLPAQRALFIELLRLSRYRYQYLFDYLSPVWPALPSSSKNKECQRHLSDMTFRLLLAEYPSKIEDMKGKLLKHHCTTNPGIVAVHRIAANLKIHFDIRLGLKDKTPKSGYRKIEILIFIERYSGLIYARAFRKVEDSNFIRTLSSFDQMLPYPIKELFFVTATDSSLPERRIRTIVEAPLFIIKNTENSVELLKNLLNKQKLASVDISFDPYTPFQQQEVSIPISPDAAYSYLDLWSFNQDLQKVINIINMRKRFRTYRGKSFDISPLSKLAIHKAPKQTPSSLQQTRKKLAKKIKLPRIFRHDDWKKPAKRLISSPPPPNFKKI